MRGFMRDCKALLVRGISSTDEHDPVPSVCYQAAHEIDRLSADLDDHIIASEPKLDLACGEGRKFHDGHWQHERHCVFDVPRIHLGQSRLGPEVLCDVASEKAHRGSFSWSSARRLLAAISAPRSATPRPLITSIACTCLMMRASAAASTTTFDAIMATSSANRLGRGLRQRASLHTAVSPHRSSAVRA